jgi:hypothetical protein
MNLRDKPAFKRALAVLADIHGREINAEILDAYFDALRPYEIGAVERAIRRALIESQFWPKPAELRELARGQDRYVPPLEEDGERVYRCLECRDQGERLRRRIVEGVDLGWFSSPCTCSAGVAMREAWRQPNSQGSIFAEAAIENERRIERLGNAIRRANQRRPT